MFFLTESARGSDSDDDVPQMKRKKHVASDSEMDSDAEGQKGSQDSSYLLLPEIPSVYFVLSRDGGCFCWRLPLKLEQNN